MVVEKSFGERFFLITGFSYRSFGIGFDISKWGFLITLGFVWVQIDW